MEFLQSTELQEEDSTTKSKESIETTKSSFPFASSLVKSAKLGPESAELKDAAHHKHHLIQPLLTCEDPPIMSFSDVSSVSSSDSGIGSSHSSSDIDEYETYRQHRLWALSRKFRDDPFTSPAPFRGRYFSRLSGTTKSGAGTSTTSMRSKVTIQLSAQHLDSRIRRKDYLVDTILESVESISLGPTPLLVELLVDLTEFEKCIPEPHFLVDYSERRTLLVRRYNFSLVVTQTKDYVNDRTVESFLDACFELDVLLGHLESIDVSNCKIPTQVSLLSSLISAGWMRWSSTKVICVFSTDVKHLKAGEAILFLEMMKPLAVKGEVSKQQIQNLINHLMSINKKAAQTLIEAGADVNITDKYGKTALFYTEDNEEVTHALIEAGADVNITDKYGKTALFYAVDNEKVTHALIEAGADVNITDKDGKTALFSAVNNEKVTHALIEASADVNITDKDGRTALFYAVNNEKVTHALIEAGADVNINDKDGKTVLLCVFDSSSKAHGERCKILLESGSSLCETTKEQESVFHLALSLCQEIIDSQHTCKRQKQFIWNEIMDTFELFSHSSLCKVAVNKGDMNLNSPLHLWASLEVASPIKYHENVISDYSFEHLLKCILNALVKCGIKLNYTSKQEQTPLHVCRTWTTVKLLLNAGAKTDVTDSSGGTPLLAAAKRNICIKKDSEHFYPDVTQTPNEFWKEVLDKKLDPWTADKNGDSVLGILIQKEANRLAKALIEVACELKLVQSDAIRVPLVITICKDKSTDKEWKVDLVKTLLKYRNSLTQGSLNDKDTALHFCCMNMLELPENKVKTSVHWKIAQHLILCGADVEATGKEDKSCLDIAGSCPILKGLLSMPINIEEVSPLTDSWKPVSKKHQGQLVKVSRGIICQQIEAVYYFKEALDKGTFGLVFVGINTQDGKEVAVKRIQTTRVETENIKKEIEDLKLVMSCDKVIQCLLCTHDKDFLYVILELMEGDLEDLLSGDNSFYINQKTELCRDICMGLDYLHSRDIIHKGIKPSNILYQVIRSGVNLKLAFFGLRQQMCNDQLSPNFRNTYESLSKERCWMAPEVLQSQIHSKSSDVFSCGLVIHYLLTNKKHPFAPAGSSKDNSMRTVIIQTVGNIAKNIIKLDETISSDAKDLVKRMLHQDEMRRPNTTRILDHGFFNKVE